MAYKTDIDFELISQLLEYDSQTGIFIWKRREPMPGISNRTLASWNSKLAGKVAGTRSPNGYTHIGILGKRISGHRAAIILTTGAAPDGEVDHINGDRGDNRICNLRVVNVQENRRNSMMPRANTSGVVGVNSHKGKWRAFIRNGKGNLHLGSFPTKEEASAARQGAAIALGFHPNHGRKAT